MNRAGIGMFALAALVGCFGCGQEAPSSDPSRAPGESSAAPGSARESRAAAPGATLAFRNIRVFDGERVIPAANVVIRDDVIGDVGPDVVIPAGTETIDGTGKTLLPGFIDCHTHAFFREQLQQAAVFGVTTELDMAGDPRFAGDMREQQKSGGARDRADLLAAGTPVTARGGHPTQIPWFAQIPTIDSPDQAAEFVDARIAEGSDYIKLIYDDGTAYGLSFPTISRETMAAVVEAARARETLAVAHVSTREGARDAISAGVAGLVHLFLDQPADAEILTLAADSGAFVVPTLTVLEGATGVASGASLVEDAELRPYLTAEDVANLQSAFPRRPASKADYAVARETVQELANMGVPILAGTDAPNPGTAHGASLHRELELLVDAGLSAEDALAAATSVPARHFGLSDRGLIAGGLRADLVLVEGDPTREIKQTRRILGVWKLGQAIDRTAYQQQVKTPVAEQKRRSTGPPPGPEGGLVSDFEGDEVTAAFGSGWTVSTDLFVGGKSTAEFRVVEGGAADSRGALEVTGTIEDRPEPRWAGVTFSPGAAIMAPADLSARTAVSFWAKGDGRTYSVMLFFQKRGFFPSIRSFTAGDEWQQHRFEIKEFDGCDGTDITGLFFGGGDVVGPFSFQIDDVRFE
ncbi:MAG TPA: CIA30 family protein [Planctomycetaceae bacterium]|nr:CIA30 family protein [Planctomycetaceae bacterium]